MTKHSETPWLIENDEDTLDNWFIRDGEGGVVAILAKGPTEEIQERQYANARLVASLPDLVEHASWICRLFGTDHPKGQAELKEHVAKLRAAIAEATE